MSQNLYQKVWDRHKVATLDNGQTQLFIGAHLLHEVTSPQAFALMRELDKHVAHPERTFATRAHIIPTTEITRPLQDNLAEAMLDAIEESTAAAKIKLFGTSAQLGVIHTVLPYHGLTPPRIARG